MTRVVLRFLLGLSIAAAETAMAQQVSDAGSPLDPASPMESLPGLGVDWPDMRPVDVAPPPPGAARPAVNGPAVNGKAEQTAVVGSADLETERHYHLDLQGLESVESTNIRSRFDEASALKKGQGQAANTAQIDRRAHDDEALLSDLLHAFGYYDAIVSTRVEHGVDQRLTVILTAEPGERYHFASVDVTGLESGGHRAAAIRDVFRLKPGDAVDSDTIVAATADLRVKLGEQGYAFAKVGDPHIVVDHDKRNATFALAVDPGGEKRIGRLIIRGKHVFGPGHLGKIARFRTGSTYDSARMEDFRRALIATGLVSSVELTPVQTADPNVVDIAVKLEPAPPRTIAGELGYGTGEGVRAQVSWTHRNFVRPEGAVTFSAVAGTQEQSIGAVLRRSNFHARDQILTAQLLASHTDRAAYDARTLTLGASLEKQTNIIWQKKWTWSIGTEFLASDERDTIITTGQPRRRTFLIAALPTSLAYDGTDSLLDPTRGYRLSARLSPEASLQAGAFGYVRGQIDASAYLPFGDGRVVLAGRTRVASITGASRDRIAPSRRYYVGGGGSVRGFGYQDIGPRDVNGDPIGGRSLVEFAVETRIRFGNFGIVPFLDAGNLYSGALPDFTGLRFGTGIGVRYYTSFGPIRVDVGTPIDRRPTDSKVAIYISLGQAF